MAWKHYLEVDCKQTFGFVNASIMEYLRLIFHFLYRDRSNPSIEPFEDTFRGFMAMYKSEGLLPLDSRNVSNDPTDPTGKATLNFNDRTAVHDSVFATSANAMNNPEFDTVVERLNMHDAPVFHYENTYDNNSNLLSRAQGLCKALRTVAGEVIRSATLLVLECDEFLQTTPNDYAQQASRDLKKLIQTIKAMECNRKLYFTEEQNADATDTIIRNTPNSTISWFHYFQFFVIQVGIMTPDLPAGHNYRPYASTLQDILDTIAQRVLPLFQEARNMDVPPKSYFCTQNYLLYMSHLILTHCREGSDRVQFLQEYCRLYNSTDQLNDRRISQAEQEAHAKREWNHKIGNFMYWERQRKAFWVQNRQLRRDGHMLYVYSQKTRHPEYYTHKANTETGQVPLYYNPTDASGYGDLSRHGPDHEFWRQATREERRAGAAAAAVQRGADDRPAGAARGHGLPPRNTPHTSTVRAAPNTAQVVPQGRRSAAPRAETDPNPQTRNMSKRATKAMKHQSAREAASHHGPALTPEEQAVLDIGLGSHLTRTARDEGKVVEELETLMLARNECFKESKHLLELYATSNREDETTELFLQAWDKLAKELNRIDGLMDNEVNGLDQNSVKGEQWSREQTRRVKSNDALNDRFKDIMLPDEARETSDNPPPAAGS